MNNYILKALVLYVHLHEIKKLCIHMNQKANDKSTINLNKHTPDIVLQNIRN